MSQLQLSVELPKFNCETSAYQLKQVADECEIYQSRICDSLEKIFDDFQQKASRRLNSYTADDVAALAKELREHLQQSNQLVVQSVFFEYCKAKSDAVLRCTQVVGQLTNKEIVKKQHFKQLATKLQKQIDQDMYLS